MRAVCHLVEKRISCPLKACRGHGLFLQSVAFMFCFSLTECRGGNKKSQKVYFLGLSKYPTNYPYFNTT